MKINNLKILVIDQEIQIRQLLKTRLSRLGYDVSLAYNGKDALAAFTKESPDLVILEILLPKLDGYSVFHKIREISQAPIIVLTALTSTPDRIFGLELGADDYIIKPFSPKELEARITSLLRRSYDQFSKLPKKKQKKLQIGNLIIDMYNCVISKNNSRLKVTGIEYNILELLIENSGKTLSRMTILDKIWGYTPERYVDTRIVDVHISRLRSKIEENPSNPDLILTVRGIGYMFRRY